MLFIVDTTKDFDTAVRDSQVAAERRHYGVLHFHDLQKTSKDQGIDLPSRVKIPEVCHLQTAE